MASCSNRRKSRQPRGVERSDHLGPHGCCPIGFQECEQVEAFPLRFLLAWERPFLDGGVMPKRERTGDLRRGRSQTSLSPNRMGELGEEHRREVAQNAGGSGSGIHACLGGVAIDQSERNQVENLLDDDHIDAGWCCCFFISPYRVAGISIQHSHPAPISKYPAH